ncbi:MAG: hypothetical protein KF878_24900 [Planctomycetes bacterium]|nr:hypothetical protein [Planctomycetota bacterium]
MTRTAPTLAALALIMPATALGIEATGHDAITTPGRPVEVRAKFERKLFGYMRPDVKRAAATIDVLGGRHAAVTDREGLARATVTPGAVGVFPITARLDRRGDRVATSRLFVFDPARPVAVVDIDGTLSDLPDWKVPFVGHRAPTFEGAPAVMAELARRFQIVYLTARDDVFDAGTRRFLALHGFPDGPVLYNDLGLGTREERAQLVPGNHGAFKLAVIEGLRARGVNVTIGVGNAETDAFAYERAGLPSYILTTKPGAGPSFRFTRYADLRPRLVADGWLVDTKGLAGALAGK